MPVASSTDLSSVSPVAFSITSYQDSKSADTSNDPSTIVMKTLKLNPVKVNSIFIILSIIIYFNNHF